MSDKNFVLIGRVEVPRTVPNQSPKIDTITIGARGDLGAVVVHVNGDEHPRNSMPQLTPALAIEVANHMARASGVAQTLSEAYGAYQVAVRDAEDRLAKVLAQESES